MHSWINDKIHWEISWKVWGLEKGRFFFLIFCEEKILCSPSLKSNWLCVHRQELIYFFWAFSPGHSKRHGVRNMAWGNQHFQFSSGIAEWYCIKKWCSYSLLELILVLEGAIPVLSLLISSHPITGLLLFSLNDFYISLHKHEISKIAICSGYEEFWPLEFKSSRNFPLSPLPSVFLETPIPWVTSTHRYYLISK